MSFGVAKFPAASPKAKFPWQPFETIKVLYATRLDSLLAISIVANAFFWSIGLLNLLAINELGISQFGLSNSMTSALSVAEMFGIAAGGLLSVYLAKKVKWYRLLAPAAAVMAICMMAVGAVPYFAESAKLACLLVALAVLGIAGGVFMILLESFIQVRPAADRKGATIAAANFAAFSGMLLSGPTLNLFNAMTITPTSDFAIMGVMAMAVAILLFIFLRKRTTDD